jgi:DNA-binding CsgD family transcriptional regulator
VEGYADPQLGDDPERRYASKEQGAAIIRALDALDARQRRLLLMRAAEGLPYEEIAHEEGLSVDAVKSLLKRARRAFRDAYDNAGTAEGAPAVLPFLARARVSFRLRYTRVRTRAECAVNAVRYAGTIDPVVQALGVASIAGAILVGTLVAQPSQTARPPVGGHHAFASGLLPAGTSRHRAPLDAPAGSLLHQSIRAGAEGHNTQVALAGTIDRSRSARRSVRIHVHYWVPVLSQGSDTWADVPCGYDNVRGPQCDIVDSPRPGSRRSPSSPSPAP